MQVTKIFKFEACHSVKDAYTSRCDRVRGGLHGHSYKVEVTLDGAIRKDGMVVDFTKVKEWFNHIFDIFDHTLIINVQDFVMRKLGPLISTRFIIFPGNPTAENMAQYFHQYLQNILESSEYNTPSGYIASVASVTVWETETGKATSLNALSGDPSMLAVSESCTEKWTKEDFDRFKHNCGLVLDNLPIIEDITIVSGTTLSKDAHTIATLTVSQEKLKTVNN